MSQIISENFQIGGYDSQMIPEFQLRNSQVPTGNCSAFEQSMTVLRWPRTCSGWLWLKKRSDRGVHNWFIMGLSVPLTYNALKTQVIHSKLSTMFSECGLLCPKWLFATVRISLSSCRAIRAGMRSPWWFCRFRSRMRWRSWVRWWC